jgi:hypothetical protein
MAPLLAQFQRTGKPCDNGLELDREAALWYYNLGFRANGFPALDGLKVLC